MAAKKKATRKTAPWERPAPKQKRSKRLSPKQKERAKQRAKRAGRSYPNLVDNMTEAKKHA